MGHNALLDKIEATKKLYLQIGIEGGRQQIMDMMSLVLRDPKIMGKDIFGKERLLKVVDGIGKCIDEYEKAWMKDNETDYYRKKLDDALAEAYGGGLADSFMVRYPYAPEYDYQKGKWKK